MVDLTHPSRIYIGGAGGAPSNNFIASLRAGEDDYHLIGASCSAADLFLADTEEAYWIPAAGEPGHTERLLGLLEQTGAQFLHVQHDAEVLAVSTLRKEIEALGVRLFLPTHLTIQRCVDKGQSSAIWQQAGLPVPRTVMIESQADLDRAFDQLGPTVWLRARTGGGGSGALPTEDPKLARCWLNRLDGWGRFTAAECLSPDTVTWSSIWYEGHLVVAQTRQRLSWNFGDRTLSGVTGITGVGETVSDPEVDDIAQQAIAAIDDRPHGIFSVDMTRDARGVPNPTEINIGRFFTTHLFFTRAGLNLAEIYVRIGLGGELPRLPRVINPLPDHLLWVRGMDTEPRLISRSRYDELVASGVRR